MPNHVHGILILNDVNGVNCNKAGKHPDHGGNPVPRRRVACNAPTGNAPTGNAPIGNISTGHPSTPPPDKNKFMSDISPKSGSVSTLIRSYKSAVTRHAHRLGFDFTWQSRFYDHIIRNDQAFERISDYIRNNPLNWQDDGFYT
ncbi:MAG: transposase [candidate division KSB1 bacterium]|nr:transposase [candidate division KSB1 bacterium]